MAGKGKGKVGRPKKDEFADLDTDWKDAVAQSSREEIEKRISDLALYNVELRKEKEEDGQLAEAKVAYQAAGQRYRDGFKDNKARIGFCKRVLDDKGGPTPTKP
jgi:hypothetical protein